MLGAIAEAFGGLWKSRKTQGVQDAASLEETSVQAELPTIEVSALPAGASGPPVRYGALDGDKFPGGYGATNILWLDYWTLRARSAELFQTNLYARGLIRRLVTNEVNTGLSLEALPHAETLGRASGSLDDWAEQVETRFELWGNTPAACDHLSQNTCGGLQARARQEALVCGDVLVVQRFDPTTRIPRIQLVGGDKIQSPLGADTPRGETRIVHGVELDTNDRHRAYWVRQEDGTSKRLPAVVGGRRLAWLVYGTDKRLDEVRGQPILSLILQSLKEIDRYRDSVLRKAVLNSVLAMYIKRELPVQGTRPFTGGPARLRGSSPVDSGDEVKKNYRTADFIPGMVLDELAPGESPHGFAPTGTDEKFADFESAILHTVAWANEIPPEILTLSFDRNYSASAASLNEFKLYLSKMRAAFGQSFCQPIYQEWLVSEVLSQRLDQPDILAAWRSQRTDPYPFAAWTRAEWAGQVKPTTDMLKLVKAYEISVDRGWTTNALVARELNGTKLSLNLKKQDLERKLARAAGVPMGSPGPGSNPNLNPAPSQGEGEAEEESNDADTNASLAN